MNEYGFLLQALFFTVNSLAVIAIVCLVRWKIKRIEAKLDYIAGLLHSVDMRTSISYVNTLNNLLTRMMKEEKYEEAARLKKVIEENIKWIDEEGKKY